MKKPKPGRPCSACGLATGRTACEECKGLGMVPVAAAEESEELGPELVRAVGEFLAAWSAIEAHGMIGFLESRERVIGGGGERLDLADEFLEALAVFKGELARLEFEDDVAEALSQGRK